MNIDDWCSCFYRFLSSVNSFVSRLNACWWREYIVQLPDLFLYDTITFCFLGSISPCSLTHWLVIDLCLQGLFSPYSVEFYSFLDSTIHGLHTMHTKVTKVSPLPTYLLSSYLLPLHNNAQIYLSVLRYFAALFCIRWYLCFCKSWQCTCINNLNFLSQ